MPTRMPRMAGPEGGDLVTPVASRRLDRLRHGASGGAGRRDPATTARAPERQAPPWATRIPAVASPQGVPRHVAGRVCRVPYPPGMIVVGLTGGIGAGKSTVSALLAELGAVVVDADAIVHEVQAARPPGARRRWSSASGRASSCADGQLDRQAVADIVFSDEQALKDLNAIVHPAVGAEIAARLGGRGRDRPRRDPRRAPAGRVGPRRPGGADRRRRRPGGRGRPPGRAAGHVRGRRPGPHRAPGQPRGAAGQGRPT